MEFLTAVYNFIVHEHPAAFAAFGTWLLGNICASFPTPDAGSGKGYIFLFNLATIVGSNLPRSMPGLRLGPSVPPPSDLNAAIKRVNP